MGLLPRGNKQKVTKVITLCKKVGKHEGVPIHPRFSKKDVLPYFFGYKMEFFFFQNNPKDLDPSCKMDLDLLDCLGRVNLVL